MTSTLNVVFYGIFNDQATKETSLRLMGIINISLKSHLLWLTLYMQNKSSPFTNLDRQTMISDLKHMQPVC